MVSVERVRWMPPERDKVDNVELVEERRDEPDWNPDELPVCVGVVVDLLLVLPLLDMCLECLVMSSRFPFDEDDS
jgi:hypothetical protein